MGIAIILLIALALVLIAVTLLFIKVQVYDKRGFHAKESSIKGHASTDRQGYPEGS